MQGLAEAFDDYSPMTVEEQFENLPEGTRAELIGGKIIMMSSLTIPHQLAAGAIFLQFGIYLEGNTCEVLYNMDVQMEEDCPDVVRPDITIVCDPAKTQNPRRIYGVPDLIVEVLSPSNPGNDFLLKMNKYLLAGVREYWVVDTERRIVHVYILTNKQFVSTVYGANQSIKVSIFDDCTVDLSRVFPPEEAIPDTEDAATAQLPSQP
ncbi:hypothetical protein AGMMS49992_03200 [Clostridia bacterium]|nr:hypothetical protein AGMMS49992_03200 [Clostridia bacterium]